MIKPNSVTFEEIETECTNCSRSFSSIDSAFSTLHSKRVDAIEEKIETLKCNLNIVIIKWNQMRLRCTLKFHMLHGHMPDILLNLNGFYGMGRPQLNDGIKLA